MQSSLVLEEAVLVAMVFVDVDIVPSKKCLLVLYLVYQVYLQKEARCTVPGVLVGESAHIQMKQSIHLQYFKSFNS